jgi:hypothetical protein
MDGLKKFAWRRGVRYAHAMGSKHPFKPELPETPCGCTNCWRLFTYDEIAEFWDEGETPVCPACGMDTVLVSTPDLIVDAHCLFAMRKTYH